MNERQHRTVVLMSTVALDLNYRIDILSGDVVHCILECNFIDVCRLWWIVQVSIRGISPVYRPLPLVIQSPYSLGIFVQGL